MGVFLNVLTAPGTSREELFSLLSSVCPETAEKWNLNVPLCRLWQEDKGSAALLSDFCCGYEEMTMQLSRMGHIPLMLSYIYDDDAWGYYFYDAGREVDSFCTVPNLLEEVDDAQRLRLRGCSTALAPYFSVQPQKLSPYLTFWQEEDDEDAWQMADFLAELGFALPEENDDVQGRSDDYERFVFLAQHNSPDNWDEASLISFCDMIELYRMEHIPEKPPRSNLILRSPEDLQMLVCFLQQFALPHGLYRMIWQTLELKDAKYGRAAVLYGALRGQLLALAPDLAELANPAYDALRVELIRALNHHDESRQTLDTLFARPDFNAAFLDDTFVLKNLVRSDAYLDPSGSPLFLERICVFFQQTPNAPYSSILLPRFKNMLDLLRDKQRRKEEQLVKASAAVPQLSSIPFFLYWLNAFCGMMNLPDLQMSLHRKGSFELDWARKFVGRVGKTKQPGCKKLSFTFQKQRFQIRFHLRYLEYFKDKEAITQPCFFPEDLMKIKNADRFFFLLPLLIPVEDTQPIACEIERRLACAAPFLTEAECRALAAQMAQCFLFSAPEEGLCEQLLDWLWDKSEKDEIDLESELDCLLGAVCPPCTEQEDDEDIPLNWTVLFDELDGIDDFLARISDYCRDHPGDFACWLSDTVQEWLNFCQARDAMSEEEKRAEFLHALPQKVFWETSEKLFLYSCEEYQNRLYPNIFCQNPETGKFAPVGAVQEFLERSSANEPASDDLRKTLLNHALGFSLDLQRTSYVSDLVYLPQKVYLDPDFSSVFSAEVSALPRRLDNDAVTAKRLDELLSLFRKGALLRLELCWESAVSFSMPGSVHISGTTSISLVLARDGDKWACFCFDDAGHDANQLISDPKGYLTSDSASIERIPFALGTVPEYSIFRKPEALFEKLPALFRSVTSARPDFQCNGMWSMITSSVYYNREKYTMDKRILGGFPPERAYNQLTDRFYLKEYPTALDTLTESGEAMHMDISGGNRDMPRFYLGRFFQCGLEKLIFHFGAQLHLVFLRDGAKSMLILLDDAEHTAYFAVADNALAPANPTAEAEPLSFCGHPAASGLVFSHLLTLRSSTDLLFACWQNRQKLLSDPRWFCTEDPCRPCPYETLCSELLQPV